MLKKILEQYLSMAGVSAAALVGNDGFVVEIASTRPVDLDALGALTSSAMRFFKNGGISMKMGPQKLLVFEYGGGAIILTPVSPEEFLAVMSETPAITGKLSYAVAQAGERVAAVL